MLLACVASLLRGLDRVCEILQRSVLSFDSFPFLENLAREKTISELRDEVERRKVDAEVGDMMLVSLAFIPYTHESSSTFCLLLYTRLSTLAIAPLPLLLFIERCICGCETKEKSQLCRTLWHGFIYAFFPVHSRASNR